MATTSSLFLYSLTVKPPSSITQAILGQFAGKKEQQIVVACGSHLMMYRPHELSGRLELFHHTDIFGIIRKMVPFRLAGTSKDLVVMTSDSGRIVVLEYQPNLNAFKQVQLETFGKSGIRRVIPGEYLANDPKGRAIMLASAEKNKLVYVMNRAPTAQVALRLSSPLEAHKPNVLVHALTGLDHGHENPLFATLEVDFADSDADPSGDAYKALEKELVYYELDLGLNHVVRKWSNVVDNTAHFLLQVPGGEDGPSGVLVCCRGRIFYMHSNQPTKVVPIPQRADQPASQGLQHIIAGATHKLKGGFFFLVQAEDGDIFKISMAFNMEPGPGFGEVSDIIIKYFDTVPPAVNLLILKNGSFFTASASGNKHFYQFESLADDDHEFEWSSDDFEPDVTESTPAVFFEPRYAQRHISKIQELDSMNPMTASKVLNLTGEDAPQIYSVHGTGARSSLKTTRQGLEVNEIVESALPGRPKAVWTTKVKSSDQFDQYIVLSFTGKTLVLSIGETVEEVENSGFETDTETLAVQLLGETGMLQIHPRGIRHICPVPNDKPQVNEWEPEGNSTIVAVATNQYQIAIALSSGELIYFEMDYDGSLAEYEEKLQLDNAVRSLSLGDVPEGRQRTSFLAVGCDDNTVRILNVGPVNTFEERSIQAVSAPPTALQIMPMDDAVSGNSALYLHIGLQSGVYLRTVLDEVNGTLSDTRSRFLGRVPIKLFKVQVHGRQCVLALSSRAWMGYSHPVTRSFTITPLSYPAIHYASSFSSEACAEGVVGIDEQNLRLFAIQDLSSSLLTSSLNLTHTPRNFVSHPDYPLFYVSETECGVLSTLYDANAKTNGHSNVENGFSDSQEKKDLKDRVLGYPRTGGSELSAPSWASCIEIVDPLGQALLKTVKLPNDEAITSICAMQFASKPGQSFLIVATAQNLVVVPRSCTASFIYTYEISDDGGDIKAVHKTTLEESVGALHGFQGRLLVGYGRNVRIYDIGRKQLLRKAQLREATKTMIVGFQSQGSRIIASDVKESVTYMVYRLEENKILPFADDTVARWTTCSAMMDYETTAGGDKFGNLWMVRCTQFASEQSDEDGAATTLSHERAYLAGAPNKLELMAHFYTQDIPTSVHKCVLSAGASAVILWTGLQGTIGVMIPFAAREDVNFFQTLETQMRIHDPPLAGRDHLIYRGYYVPVKGAIDGDMCERYLLLPADKQSIVAQELEMSVREVNRKITDFRARFAW